MEISGHFTMYPDSNMVDPHVSTAESDAMELADWSARSLPPRVVIIGAGQAGLSVAYFLARMGFRTDDSVLVVDRSPRPGGAWQFRWEALRLGVAHRVNDLPGMPEMGLRFADADQSRPARDVVSAYYDRYERHYGIHVHRPIEVTAVRGDEAGFRLDLRSHAGHPGGLQGTATATVSAEAVVNATGTWGTPFVPWYPGRDAFRGRQLSTSEYRSAMEFRDLDVVVVGGGTSAVGFLLELEGIARSTYWCSRSPVDWRDVSDLDLESAQAAVGMQDAAARSGATLPPIVDGTGIPKSRRIRGGIERGVLDSHPMFVRMDGDGIVLADGSRRHADAVIWATGFRPDIGHLAPLHLREPGGGVRVLDGRSDRDPRVFFAGYGPSASTIGANRAGRRIARQVVAALRARDQAGSAV